MAKSTSRFFCQNCGAESSKWIGRCPSCHAWNTYVEEKMVKTGNKTQISSYTNSQPTSLEDVNTITHERIFTHLPELNRVLGGGLVKGSLILIGGEPGIGKSTLALQVAVSSEKDIVLYISGEESTEQIKLRAGRISPDNHSGIYYNEINLEKIIETIKQVKPQMVVIDSIQTLYADFLDATPGSVSQVRECAARLLKLAKETGIVIILIGHITKDGSIAGPKVLEHIVDVVLQFEGDQQMVYRLLRAKKNRYGSTAELGIFEMRENGLIEIENPSHILVNPDTELSSGVAIAATVSGLRTFMVEVQALVSTAVYGTPQRSTTGFDTRRLNMLLAVLEKRAGFHLAAKDVFLNIAGGLKIDDPALDLAVISAILSSALDTPIPSGICFAGEVSLTGGIRPVIREEERIKEVSRLGYKKAIIADNGKKTTDMTKSDLQLISTKRVEEVFRILFKK